MRVGHAEQSRVRIWLRESLKWRERERRRWGVAAAANRRKNMKKGVFEKHDFGAFLFANLFWRVLEKRRRRLESPESVALRARFARARI